MIVRMKKVNIVVRSAWTDQILEDLRKMGVLHLHPVQYTESDMLEDLREKERILERSLAVIPHTYFAGRKDELTEPETKGLDAAKELLSFMDELKKLEEDLRRLHSEYDEISIWGRFSPKDIEELRERGVILRFFQCREQELSFLPADLHSNIISKRGETLLVAIISMQKPVDVPLQEVSVPHRGLTEIEAEIERKKKRIHNIKEKMPQLFSNACLIQETLDRLYETISYEEARTGMGMEEDISYLMGFCPEPEMKKLHKKAEEEKWGLLVEEPTEKDMVPTLIRRYHVA